MRPLRPQLLSFLAPFALLGILVALLPGAALAADIVWTNASGGNWNVASNWNSGAGPVPGTTDRALITTAGTYTVTLDVSTTIDALVLGAGPANGTQTLFASSKTLTLNGASSVEAGGYLNVTASTLNGAGPMTNHATIQIAHTSMSMPVDNQGTLQAQGTSALNGALTQTGMLRVQGITAVGIAQLTIANGFTNDGTIEINDLNNVSTTLIVTSGALLNAAGATIHVTSGGGVFRNLNATLDNHGTLLVNQAVTMAHGSSDHFNRADGTITVNANLTINQTGTTPTFTNSGTVTVASGRTLTVDGSPFTHDGGSLSGAGFLVITDASTVSLVDQSVANVTLVTTTTALQTDGSNSNSTMTITNSTVNGPGNLINQSGRTMTIANCTINTALANSATLVWRGNSTHAGALTQTNFMRVQGLSTFGHATLTVVNGFTNNGTIELFDSNLFSATLNVTNGMLVNAAGATINATPGGGRVLGVALDNYGTFNVNRTVNMNRLGSAHVNRASGVIAITGGDLTMIQNYTNSSMTNSGTVTIASGRTWNVSYSVFTHDGGSLSGAGQLYIYANPPATTSSLVDQSVAFVTLQNSTLALQTDGASSNSTWTISNSTVNGPGRLICSPGKTMTITGGTINAALVNQAAITCRATCAVNGPFAQTGYMLLQGLSLNGHCFLTSPNGFTNDGTIEMTGLNGFGAFLTVNGGPLVNAAGRFINVLAGALGSRNLTATLVNHGTLALSHALTMNGGSADHVNAASGVINVNGGNLTLTQTGTTPSFVNQGTVSVATGRTWTTTGGTLTNSGNGRLQGTGTITISGTAFTQAAVVAPGASPGVLTIAGSYPEDPLADLEIEIGGTALGTQYDRLAVSGTLTLAGKLHIQMVNGFSPSAGDAFRVLTAGSVVGIFSEITGLDQGGISFEPQYDATGLTLVVASRMWSRLMPTGLPPARDRHAAVYDPGSNRMIVFGGEGNTGPLGDAWVLTNANGTGGAPAWTQLAPSGAAPAARANHSAVYDPTGNRLIVYGGDDAGVIPTTFGDVHVLSNANGLGGAPQWSELIPTGGPPAVRTQHSAVFDFTNDRMIVFGGRSDALGCGSALDEIWILSNTAGAAVWSSLAPVNGPPAARWAHVAAWDAAGNRMTVFGGNLTCSSTTEDTWVLESASAPPAWLSLSTTGAPPTPWSDHRGVYDPIGNRLIVFGGNVGSTPIDDLWNLTSANGQGGVPGWAALATASYVPDARARHSAVQDQANRRMTIFAGWSGSARLSDVWVLDQISASVTAVPLPMPIVSAGFTGFSRPPSPNPASGTLRFSVAAAQAQHVEISVLDLAGRRVASLHRGVLEAGEHSFAWSATNANAGLYLLLLEAGGVRETRKVCVLR